MDPSHFAAWGGEWAWLPVMALKLTATAHFWWLEVQVARLKH
jgi:hypothetical protein